MQLLCFAALLLSAVAAPRGESGSSVTKAPREGISDDPGRPVWTDETLPWVSTTASRPVSTSDGTWRPSQTDEMHLSNSTTPSSPGWRPMNTTDGPWRPSEGPAVSSGGLNRRPRSFRGRHHRVNVKFTCIAKVDSVTLQDVNEFFLKEGESIFVMRKAKQYVKLHYSSEPKKLSLEYGNLTCDRGNTPDPEPPRGDDARRTTSVVPLVDKSSDLTFQKILQVENVTYQPCDSAAPAVSRLPLAEGDNIFLMARRHRGGHRRPVMGNLPQPYVNLTYHAAQPSQLSIEYGIVSKAPLP